MSTKSGLPTGKNTLFVTIILVATIMLFLGGLKLLDLTLWSRQAFYVDRPQNPFFNDTFTHYFDLYPYTGGHAIANQRIVMGENVVRAGDHGFLVDIDLDAPPPKQPREVRVLLTGGSAAVGWGASSQDKMIYRLLERSFNAHAPCRATLRVFNLAMGGSASYQNYIALNRWGHQLEPDIVLSISGSNDFRYTPKSASDAYDPFYSAAGYILMTRQSSDPAILRWISKWYPGLVNNTPLGLSLRAWRINGYVTEARRRYLENFPEVKTEMEAFSQIAEPLFVHALRSIKRDFRGIPIFLAYQPMMIDFEPHFNSQEPFERSSSRYFMYERFIRETRQQLEGYLNREWRFVNLHQYYKTHLARRFPPDPRDRVHMSDGVQAAMAGVIGGELFPEVCRRVRAERAANEEDVPDLYGVASHQGGRPEGAGRPDRLSGQQEREQADRQAARGFGIGLKQRKAIE